MRDRVRPPSRPRSNSHSDNWIDSLVRQSGWRCLADSGPAPQVWLVGTYRFAYANSPGTLAQFDETDAVTITIARPVTPFIAIGGGLKRDLTRRLGLQA